jgi:DNA-binding transcriptional ArsR family regulator
MAQDTRENVRESSVSIERPAKDTTAAGVFYRTSGTAIGSMRIRNERAVVNHIARLREKGIVKRVRRARRSERAVYARVGVEYETPPFDDMTLAQVIAEVLSKREPLRVAELALAVLEAGYDTVMSSKSFRPGDQFVRDGNKWSLR